MHYGRHTGELQYLAAITCSHPALRQQTTPHTYWELHATGRRSVTRTVHSYRIVADCSIPLPLYCHIIGSVHCIAKAIKGVAILLTFFDSEQWRVIVDKTFCCDRYTICYAYRICAQYYKHVRLLWVSVDRSSLLEPSTSRNWSLTLDIAGDLWNHPCLSD